MYKLKIANTETTCAHFVQLSWMISNGKVNPHDQIWDDQQGDWVKLYAHPDTKKIYRELAQNNQNPQISVIVMVIIGGVLALGSLISIGSSLMRSTNQGDESHFDTTSTPPRTLFSQASRRKQRMFHNPCGAK